MPSIYGAEKPPFGTPIDWGHPLAKGLVMAYPFNEGGGGVAYDNAKGIIPIVEYGSVYHDTTDLLQTVGPGPWLTPEGANCNVSSNGLYSQKLNLSGNPIFAIQPPLTIVYRFRQLGPLPNQGIAGVTASSSNVSPYVGFEMGIGNDGKIGFDWNASGTYNGITSASGLISIGGVYTSVGVITPSSSQKLYLNGSLVASGTNAPPPITYSNTSELFVGSPPQYSGLNAGNIGHAMYIYNRALSQQEALWLTVEPYAMFDEIPYSRPMMKVGGGVYVPIVQLLQAGPMVLR